LNREKELKGLLRTKKDLLIQQTNPDWDDLGYRLFPEFYDTGNKEQK
jgi:predicted GIY-YIG superfamily endonuclease